MSKIKIVGSLIFMASVFGISVFWLGVFPQWSIANQSVTQLHDSSEQNEASAPLQNRMDDVDQYVDQASVVIDSEEDPSLLVKESEAVTPPKPPSSTQPMQGKYPQEETPSQSDQSKPSTEEELFESEQNRPQSKETNFKQEEPQPSTALEASPGTLLPQPDQSDVKTNIIISGIGKGDLSPTPLPGPLGTPIQPYYDEAGNPPTAPGLAMRQRKFQPENGKVAYLTFDDGPYPSTTPKILDILAKEDVRATFFTIGQQVELYPDLLKAVYEQDHGIGNHTYSHNMAEVYKGPKNFLDDVRKAEEIVYQTIGIRPQIVRAPGGTVGHFNINYFNTIDAAGYLMEDWNVDPGDTNARLFSEDQLIRNVEEQIQGKTRVVILLHDLVGKNATIDALPEIIELLKKQGFSFGVLGPDVLPIVFSGGLQS